MSHTSREPSTKFYGPNYPFVDAVNPNHWLITLHNLEPGDTWNPAWAPELNGQLTFIPLGQPATWLWPGIDFWGTMRFNILRRTLIIRERVGRTYAFLFNVAFCETKWAVNELVVPTGNFAFNGTAELIFRKA